MSYAARRAPAPAHLLMVDDNRLGLHARKTIMEELGYRVTIVGTPAEALAHMRDKAFDLVITDYKMPSMNGKEFIHRLRKMELHTPVVLISGYVEALGLNEQNTGADVVIPKSANEVAHMLRAVKGLLRARKRPPASQSISAKAQRRKA